MRPSMPDVLFCSAVSDLKEEIASLVWWEGGDGVLTELLPEAVPGDASASFFFCCDCDCSSCCSSRSCVSVNLATEAAESRCSWFKRPTSECSAYIARARERNELAPGTVELACLPTMLRSS